MNLQGFLTLALLMDHWAAGGRPVHCGIWNDMQSLHTQNDQEQPLLRQPNYPQTWPSVSLGTPGPSTELLLQTALALTAAPSFPSAPRGQFLHLPWESLHSATTTTAGHQEEAPTTIGWK